MINQRQHLTLTQTPAVAVLLLPVNLAIAIVARVCWVDAAVIQGDDEG